jgi:hypothetical protein
MKRRYDWRTRLFTVIAENRSREFIWGEWDCARFSAACVEAMTGEDFFAPYSGQYDDAMSSAKALVASGHRDLVSLASSLFTECHPSMARVGDLAAIDCGDDGYALCVVLGDHLGCITPAHGYGILPRDNAVIAWRVG